MADLSGNILLAYRQTVYIESEDISITFREFSESRCPSGVQCFWEGEGIVELVVEALQLRVAEETLALADQLQPSASVAHERKEHLQVRK